MYPCRGAGLEAHEANSRIRKGAGQMGRRQHSVRTRGIGGISGDDPAVKVGSGTDNNGPDLPYGAKGGLYLGNPAVLDADTDYLCLYQLQIFCIFQGLFHDFLVFAAIRLHPGGMNRRALATVENS